VAADIKKADTKKVDAKKATTQNIDSQDYVLSDFQKLSEPERRISGAYYGLGLGASMMSHSILVRRAASDSTLKSTATQLDLSLILGFGSDFYNKYYAGIEFDMFKRFPVKRKKFTFEGQNVCVEHQASIGLNMDARFGYQLPHKGILPYVTVGFARVIGNVNGSSFGSFYPTFGIGIEHKLNQKCNVRFDIRAALTSKEDQKTIGNYMTAESRPSKFSVRISFTRNL
jgi:hypothetical protein